MKIYRILLSVLLLYAGLIEAATETNASCTQVYHIQHFHQDVQTQHQTKTCCQNESNAATGKFMEDIKKQFAALQTTVQNQQAIIEALKKDLKKHDVPRDCEEIRKLGSKCLVIDPDGPGCLPPFKVKCDLSLTPARIIIEHNYPTKTEVQNAPDHPKGKTYSIQYDGVSKAQLVFLTQTKKCSQSLRYDCHGSVITHVGEMRAYWKDREGNKMNYWPGGKDFGCACGISKTCPGGTSHFCNCEKNDMLWRFDEGTITDDSRLPVSSLYFTDTNDANEKGHFTLGPLICY